MHPPFIHTDHRVGPQTTQHHTDVRRSKPERLDLNVMTQGWPPVWLSPHDHTTKEVVDHGPKIFLVPPPRKVWRDVLGRFLIRLGQRMITSNGPG